MSLPRDSVIKTQAERLREPLRWREYLPHLVDAVGKILGEEVELYVIGSAVERRLTIDSDIDVVVITGEVPKPDLKRAQILSEIWREMEEKGVPWWYPFKIHLMAREEFEILEKGRALKACYTTEKATDQTTNEPHQRH